MLVTGAVTRPGDQHQTHCPQPTVGAGCSLRRAPDYRVVDRDAVPVASLPGAGGRLTRVFPPSGPELIGRPGCPDCRQDYLACPPTRRSDPPTARTGDHRGLGR